MVFHLRSLNQFALTLIEVQCYNLGLSDLPGDGMVKSYCPRCMEVYTPRSSRHHHTDGAYFGTGFPHMLFMVHPEYRPKKPSSVFVPKFVPMSDVDSFASNNLIWYLKFENLCRLYGFKIHPLAYQLQQQAANNFKTPARGMNFNNGKRP